MFDCISVGCLCSVEWMGLLFLIVLYVTFVGIDICLVVVVYMRFVCLFWFEITFVVG